MKGAAHLDTPFGNTVSESWSSPASVAVAADIRNESDCAAAALAMELHLPLLTGTTDGEGFDLLLLVRADRLELRETRRGGAGSVFADFLGGPVGYRRKSAMSHRQPIALAVGLRRGPLHVVDATAGLARDAFLLACLGCTVTAVERSAVLGALVRDGLRRAEANGSAALCAVLDRIKLIVDDARRVLAGSDDAAGPDVVYLDPMYSPISRRALPKKEMQICRRLVGDDPDAGELFEIARRVARKRVVVKRHPHAPPLAPEPTMRFTGKQARYDVYQQVV